MITGGILMISETSEYVGPYSARMPIVEDLKRQFQKAQWRILPGDGEEEVGLQLSNSEVRYTLRRKSETREIWFDGYVEMIWTEAVDTSPEEFFFVVGLPENEV